MGAAAPALSVVGGVVSGIGALVELGQGLKEDQLAREEALEAQRDAEMKASDSMARGYKEASLARMRAAGIADKQRVAYAASGVDGTVGTAARVQADTEAMGELDALTLQNDAVREAWGLKRAAGKMGRQAALTEGRSAGRVAGTLLGLGGTAVSVGARVADYYDDGVRGRGRGGR